MQAILPRQWTTFASRPLIIREKDCAVRVDSSQIFSSLRLLGSHAPLALAIQMTRSDRRDSGAEKIGAYGTCIITSDQSSGVPGSILAGSKNSE